MIEEDKISVVIDTDCLNRLYYDLKHGKEILKLCNIIICEEIKFELNKKTFEKLEKQFQLKVIKRNAEIIERTGMMIHKMTQHKELGKKYIRNQNIKIRNKGECECIAVAYTMNKIAVLLDQDAFRKLKRYANVYHLVNFGKEILKDELMKKEYLQSCHEILHI